MDGSGAPGKESWRFLYRTDAGRIDAPTWRRGAVFLAAVLALLTLVLWYALPFAHHDLRTTPLLSVSALAANLYVVVYSFALILIGICYYNLSAKRWRDIGRPAALAGVLPLLVLLAGALHWLAAQTGIVAISHMLVTIADIGVVIVAAWNAVELGGLIPAARRHD